MISNTFAYKNFILSSVKSEFRSKFIGSSLGAFWAFLHPLAQVAVYAFILSSVMSAKLPGIDNKYAYSIFLISGMLCWSLFSEILTRSVTVFVENANMLKKISFPKIALPATILFSALINNAILFAAVLVALLLLGHPPAISALWIVPLVFLTVSIALGVGILLGVVNVFIRDISHIVPIGMQFLFWFTPIVYMPSIIPAEFAELLCASPLYAVVGAYQSIILYGQSPSFQSLLYPALFATLVVSLALFLLKRANSDMADAL